MDKDIKIKRGTYGKDLLDRYQKIYGDRGLKIEISYKNGKEVKYGRKGSSRIDVLDTKTKTAYDYKFTRKPGKGLSKKQINKIKMNAGRNVRRVIEVNP